MCARLVVLLPIAVSALAQSSAGGGTIQGTVKDAAGLVLAGARVSILRLATGVATNTLTNAEGYYATPPINIGRYKIRVEAPGMKAWEGQADRECAAHLREPLLTFVVAGGGFAGVETIAGMNDFLRAALRFYPHLREPMLRVVLVHPGATLLPELGEKLGTYAQKKLAERNVEIRVNTKVTGVSEDEVTLSDGTRIRTKTVVWTAGTSPNPLLSTLPCANERGRVVVNEYLEVADWPGVWALGDCAVVPDRNTGMACPPTAQHALREGKTVAHNIAAPIRGGTRKPFSFKTIGQLAAIGRRTGVANILGVNFSGFLAWWLWRTIYLSKLPRFDKKLRVALDWTLDLVFSKDLVQFMTFRAPAVSHAEENTRPRTVARIGSL